MSVCDSESRRQKLEPGGSFTMRLADPPCGDCVGAFAVRFVIRPHDHHIWLTGCQFGFQPPSPFRWVVGSRVREPARFLSAFFILELVNAALWNGGLLIERSTFKCSDADVRLLPLLATVLRRT